MKIGDKCYVHAAYFLYRRRLEDRLSIDLEEVGRGVWIGLIWLGIGKSGGFCKCGNELQGS